MKVKNLISILQTFKQEDEIFLIDLDDETGKNNVKLTKNMIDKVECEDIKTGKPNGKYIIAIVYYKK